MAKILTFEIPGEPNGQGRPRFSTFGGHVKAYDPEKSRNYKAYVRLLATEAVRKAGWKCTDRPVIVTMTAKMSIAKSKSNKFYNAAIQGIEFPTKKPDTSNIVKGVEDALNGLVWGDDKQIVSSTINKKYAEEAGVTVRVVTLEQGERLLMDEEIKEVSES